MKGSRDVFFLFKVQGRLIKHNSIFTNERQKAILAAFLNKLLFVTLKKCNITQERTSEKS